MLLFVSSYVFVPYIEITSDESWHNSTGISCWPQLWPQLLEKMQRGSTIQRTKHLVEITEESELDKVESFFFSSFQVYTTSIWCDRGRLLLIKDYKKTKKLILGFHLFFILCLRMFSLGSSIDICVKLIMS